MTTFTLTSLEALSLNIVTLGNRASAYEFWGDKNIQLITYVHVFSSVRNIFPWNFEGNSPVSSSFQCCWDVWNRPHYWTFVLKCFVFLDAFKISSPGFWNFMMMCFSVFSHSLLLGTLSTFSFEKFIFFSLISSGILTFFLLDNSLSLSSFLKRSYFSDINILIWDVSFFTKLYFPYHFFVFPICLLYFGFCRYSSEAKHDSCTVLPTTWRQLPLTILGIRMKNNFCVLTHRQGLC